MRNRFCVGSFFVASALFGVGCINLQPNKVITNSPGTPNSKVAKIEETPKAKPADGPKRNALPQTEIAVGRLKEEEAESDAVKKNPELQARYREEARRAYFQALKIDPNNLDAMRQIGKLYAKLGDCDRAQDTFKKAMVKYPKDAGLWYDLGTCHQRRRDFAESVRCFSKALELDPENRDYMKHLGITLAWTGRINDGLSLLTRAYGSASLANYYIACIYDQREQPDQAKLYLRASLRENPNLDKAQILLDHLERGNAPLIQRVSLNSPVFN